MRRYRLKNLDCPNCAAKIEDALRKEEGVSFVSLNFAAGEMVVDAEDHSAVERVVRGVEPDVTLEEILEEEEGLSKRPLLFMAVSGVLLTVSIVMGDIHPYAPVLLLSSYLLVGWKILLKAFRNIIHGRVFDENFLLTVATLSAIAIHELPEAVAVMLFYSVGEYLQDAAVERSRRKIKALLSIKPTYANVRRGGRTEKVSPEEVRPGEIILVKPGEMVPLDGVVVEGTTFMDTSVLTGESRPRRVSPGDEVLSGMINGGGLITVRVTKEFRDSSVSRILHMVMEASARKSRTERFITKFSRYYTPGVVGMAVMVALLPPIFIPGATFETWIYRALVLLLISCPCALVLSIPLGYFAGVGRSARDGVLVKGANYLDVLTRLSIVAFDKTGTLTEGSFSVVEISPRSPFTEEDILRYAAHAEAHSSHPIARSVLERWGGEVDESLITEYTEIPGHGVRAVVGGRVVLVGNDRLMHREGVEHDTCEVGGTVIHVVVDGVYAGYMVISDRPKEDAREAVRELKELGISRVIMLTGDDESVARRIADELGLDAYHAELLPEDKVRIVQSLKEEVRDGGTVAFVGDGINDAPVIAVADVGIAMGALGSDAAIETADVVVMDDRPSRLPRAVRVARKTRRVVIQNIVLAIGVKTAFIALGVAGLATMWEAVFADVGVALIAVINSLRVLR